MVGPPRRDRGRRAIVGGRTCVAVVATRGAEGVQWADGDRHGDLPAHRVAAVDTTAAGDCFTGVLAAALDRGGTLDEAVRRAIVAAALACTRPGTQGSLPDAAETDAALAAA